MKPPSPANASGIATRDTAGDQMAVANVMPIVNSELPRLDHGAGLAQTRTLRGDAQWTLNGTGD